MNSALEANTITKIGLLRLSAIGDVTLMVPTVRAIQRRYPAAEITWIISEPAHSYLQGLSGVNFLVIKKPRSLSDYWRCRAQLKDCRFDVLLAAQASLTANLLYPLIKAPVKLGFDKARARDAHRFFVSRQIDARKEHLLDGFMQFAGQIGAERGELEWELAINEQDRQWAQEQLSGSTGWIAINPAASVAARNWLPERYAALIDRLVEERGVSVVLTGGGSEAELGLARDVQNRAQSDCLNLVGQTSLKSLAALLGQVDLLIAPDTGPAHIAVAMGTPVVGLYACASPELSGPYLYSHLTVNKYPEAVRTFLNKDPARESLKTRVHNPEAMALIRVEDVLEKVALHFDGEGQ